MKLFSRGINGGIKLSDFIKRVKAELIEAATSAEEEKFFTLTEVELEAEFGLEAGGTAGFNLVVDLKAQAKGHQAHRVKLKFIPIPDERNPALRGLRIEAMEKKMKGATEAVEALLGISRSPDIPGVKMEIPGSVSGPDDDK